MRQLELFHIFGAMDGVHDLDATIRVLVTEAVKDELEVGYRVTGNGSVVGANGSRYQEKLTIRLLSESKPNQRIEGERRIPDPTVSVIPIPHAANVLWQTECRTGNHSTCVTSALERHREPRG
jgi:hypothetical protein